MKVNGSCLCESVKFSFEAENKHFGACHCLMCRKWGGGPAFAVEAKSNIEFTGEDNVKIFDSSKWAQRGFCKNCGSNLFYRLKNHPFTNFNLGALDGHESFKFNSQIFIDQKPDNYEFANKTDNLTQAQVMEIMSKEL